MKAANYLGGMILGTLVGVGIGYWIATDPAKRRKINRFARNVEEKFEDIKGKVEEKIDEVKELVMSGCDCTDDDLLEEEIIIATMPIQEEPAKESKKK